MRFIAAAFVLCVTAAPALADGSGYLAARDSYVIELSSRARIAGADPKALQKESDAALNRLQSILSSLIGPVYVAGFTTPPRINLQTLLPGDDFGLLDGMTFSNGTEELVVTTPSLLLRHGPDGSNIRGLAGGEYGYFTQVFGGEARYYRASEVPVDRPVAIGVARAALVVRTTGDGPKLPDCLVVSLATADRVLFLRADLPSKLWQIAACQTRWNETQVHEAYLACWREHAAAEAFFPAVIRQAQSLVDRLASSVQ